MLKETYNLDAELTAGELWFPHLSLKYEWEPPIHFHMWTKLDGEIIDIAAHGITQREEFKPGEKFFNTSRDINIPIVWERIPYDDRVYMEAKNDIDKIESPVDEEDYKRLYKYASELIDAWNNKQ